MSGRRGLSDTAFAQLLAQMRDSPAPAAVPAARRQAAGFETLPRYQELQTQQAAAQMLGLENPYHRLHEARSGALARIGGRQVVNFASYDYLGLNGHPRITQAVCQAVADWGTSVSGSRLSSGERPAHRALEEALARVCGTEDALVFVSGHATALAVIPTLMGPDDLVLSDAFMHNSVVLGAQYAPATRRSFPHNDLDALEATLERDRDRFARTAFAKACCWSVSRAGTCSPSCAAPRACSTRNRGTRKATTALDPASGMTRTDGVLGHDPP